MGKSRHDARLSQYFVLIAGTLVILAPLVWMILTSFKDLGESLQVPTTIFPNKPILDNYIEVIERLPFMQLVLNTFLVIGGVIIGQILLGSLTAFAISVIKIPGGKIYMLAILLISMVPGEIFIVPVYRLLAQWGLTNTLWALIIPDTLNVFSVLLMYQAFEAIPKSYVEAARLENASWFTIYWKIMLPLSKSSLVSLSIIAAVGSFKQVLWPIIVNNDLTKMPLGPGLAQLQGMYFTRFNLIMAADVLAVIPMLLIFLLLQKQFMQSFAGTGEK